MDRDGYAPILGPLVDFVKGAPGTGVLECAGQGARVQPDRITKRGATTLRLRGGFLTQLGPKLTEFSDLLSEGSQDSLDSVVAELRRIADTSAALGLDEVAHAASEAAVLAGRGSPSAHTLGRVADAVCETLEPPFFGPIGVVAGRDWLGRLQRIREVTSEPLRLATQVGALSNPLATRPWAALLVPVDQVEVARAGAAGCPAGPPRSDGTRF